MCFTVLNMFLYTLYSVSLCFVLFFKNFSYSFCFVLEDFLMLFVIQVLNRLCGFNFTLILGKHSLYKKRKFSKIFKVFLHTSYIDMENWEWVWRDIVVYKCFSVVDIKILCIKRRNIPVIMKTFLKEKWSNLEHPPTPLQREPSLFN